MPAFKNYSRGFSKEKRLKKRQVNARSPTGETSSGKRSHPSENKSTSTTTQSRSRCCLALGEISNSSKDDETTLGVCPAKNSDAEQTVIKVSFTATVVYKYSQARPFKFAQNLLIAVLRFSVTKCFSLCCFHCLLAEACLNSWLRVLRNK